MAAGFHQWQSKMDAQWDKSEESVPVDLILLHKSDRKWPADQGPKLWNAASKFVAMPEAHSTASLIRHANNAILPHDLTNVSCLH